MKILCAAVATALPFAASAVSVSSDGLGQALIYPYYTARSSAGNPFNTYLSIVNTRATVKALRVRFREARNGKETAAFNLFLAPNDVWTGAVVPDGVGTRLVSADTSCVQPPFGPLRGAVAPPSGLSFTNAAFSGALFDGAGDGLDRTREGYVEVLEMAELRSGAANQATHVTDLFPQNCTGLATIAASDLAPPTGGLSGTLTLINVSSGLDFTVAAEALDSLARQPYYRAVNDPYPAFTANEIDPVSIVHANGATYRSTWTRGLDAVHAALTRTMTGEYVYDSGVAAATDWVMTLPTRYAAVSATSSQAPFVGRTWRQNCGGTNSNLGEPVNVTTWTREGDVDAIYTTSSSLSTSIQSICGSANVMTIAKGTLAARTVYGSATESTSFGVLRPRTSDESGWVRFELEGALVSRGDSTRTDDASGTVVVGPHTYSGMPVVGLVSRSLTNGFLSCGGALCQGNYGGAYPMSYKRQVSP